MRTRLIRRTSAPARAFSAGAWRTLVDVASTDELEAARPQIATLPPGTVGKVIITSPFWFLIGPAADLPGAEQTWAQMLTPSGVEVIDAYGEGLHTAVIEWRIPADEGAGAAMAFPVAVISVLAAIAAVAIALGWAITRIQVLFREVAGTLTDPSFFIPVLLVVGAVVLLSGGGARLRKV